MPHIRFNWVDILFVTLLIRICYIGFKNGFFPEFLRLVGLLSAFIFSFNNYILISRFLSSHTSWVGAKPELVSFLFVFLCILFIFKILALFVSSFLGSEDIPWANRSMGLIVGLGRGLLLSSIICTLFVNSPFEYLSRTTKDKSFSSQYISGIVPFVYRFSIDIYPWKNVEAPLARLLDSKKRQ